MHQPNHPDHDLLLIAAHAAGDLDGPERTHAQALLDTCNPCADLHHDLVAIAAATRALPRLATAPRDFRLSPEQADGLRRGSWLRAFLAQLRGARFASRPVAATFTSLGVAGLLVATLLPGMLGSAASLAPERQALDAAATLAPAAPGAAAPGASAGGEGMDFGGKNLDTASSGPGIAVVGRETQAPGFSTDTSTRQVRIDPPSLLFVGSLALLAIGLLLFGLRFAGRRLR